MFKKSSIFFLLGLFLISVGIFAASTKVSYMDAMPKLSYMDVMPKDAYKMIMDTPNIIIVDVSPIYAKGHLPKAINAYVGDGTLDKELEKWDKNATYLVYCHTDEASMLGAKKLIDAGFKNVYRLKGNYSAWVEAGLPIEK